MIPSAVILCSFARPAYAQPAINPQGGDHGPPVVVPTDVTGGQITQVGDASAAQLRIRFEKFPDKFTCKKCLIQEDTGTTCGDIADGAITLETGAVLVAPADGTLLVHTKEALIAVPKGNIALIRCVGEHIAIFNLAGRELVIHLIEGGVTPDPSSIYSECIGLGEGFAVVSRDNKESSASGILQYVGPLASPSVVIAAAMRDCKLAVIDPMTVLERDSIMKLITAKWLSVLRKVEETTERVGIWEDEEGHHGGR